MSTRSSSRNLFPPLDNPELTIQRISRTDPTLLNDSEMAAEGNGDPPVPDLRTMEELCQPSLNGRGGPNALIAIQAMNFGLKNDMIQQVQNSCQFHDLPGDDANKHLDKFLHVTQSIKVNGFTDNALRLYLFPHSLTHHATAWFDQRERYKLSIDRCPNHNMLHVTQIDTFYNGLTLRHHDTIDVAVGGTFMKRHPEECYDLIENITTHHNDWDTSAQRSESSSSITSSSDTKIAALKAEMAEINKNLMRVLQVNQQVKAITPSCETWGGPHSFNDCPATVGNTQNVYAAGAYQVVERETEATKDTVHTTNNGSTEDVQPPVVQNESPILNSELVVALIIEPIASSVSAPRPNQRLSIPYPSRMQEQKLRDKANDQREKFFQIFNDLNFNISFADALILMPKFGLTIKTLLTNKDKVYELSKMPLNEHCSAVLLKKFPEKLVDPDKFLIPCDFPRMDECLALTDLGASINLMPLSVWNKLSLPDLSPTCMTLELADHSISCPVGVAKDVFVKVGTFHFPADFVVVDFDADPRVPLILGRSFLTTGRALIDVFEGKLTLRVGKEAITFNLDQTSRYSANYNDMTANRIDVIDMACEEFSQEFLGFSDVIASGNPTPYYDPIVSTTSSTLTPFGNSDSFSKSDDKLPVIITKDLSVEEKNALITVLKSHKRAIAWKLFDIKGIDPEFCTHKILMEEDFEPAVQHERRFNPKIHDVIKNEVLKLLDAGLIYPISDSSWVSPVHCVPKNGGFTVVENEENELIQTRLVTEWRDHFPLPFMDQMLERLAGNLYYYFLDGLRGYFQIPIDPKDQEKTKFACPYETFAYHRMPFGLCNAPEGIEVDKAKVDVTAKLPHPRTVKGIRSFLGHAGFYRRFIQDFSKIARPMTHLLKKDTSFFLSKECVEAFQTLKRKLTEAPILIAPD
nr:DNA-directed DNA polymerase [Tanacetum cinerariifolium]